MAIVTNIISAIGNNNSIYPLLVRDCGIEVPVKIYKTYKQNEQDKEIAYLATRERLIDEYATSAVWLGGIPLIGSIANYIIKKKGFAPEVNIKLYNEEEGIQGLKQNIEKFKIVKGAEKAVADLEKVLNNKAKYKSLQGYKFLSEMVIPIALMGFIIPKLVFAMTAKTRAKKESLEKQQNLPFDRPERSTTFYGREVFDKFTLKNPKKITFKGGFAGAICDLRTIDKMAITDGGYAIGRVATARKKNERIDLAFKMAGMMYLNFVAPKQIEKLLNKFSQGVFKLNVNLDPTILADERIIKGTEISLPKSGNAKDLLEFVDNPDNAKSLFVEYAEKFKKIKMLDSGVRDPRAYVDVKDLGDFRDNLAKFMDTIKEIGKPNSAIPAEKQAEASLKLVKKYVGRAKAAKTFNILANVGLSSYLLASVLPDAQFAFRKLVTGSKLEPGLIQDEKK